MAWVQHFEKHREAKFLSVVSGQVLFKPEASIWNRRTYRHFFWWSLLPFTSWRRLNPMLRAEWCVHGASLHKQKHFKLLWYQLIPNSGSSLFLPQSMPLSNVALIVPTSKHGTEGQYWRPPNRGESFDVPLLHTTRVPASHSSPKVSTKTILDRSDSTFTLWSWLT